jgi:hypothetical protein
MSALEKVQDTTAIVPRMSDLSPEYAEIMVLGNVLQKSGYFKDVRDQAQAVTKILFGRELGFSPIVSMGGIHIIEGKPALSSNLMATLVKRSGKYDYRVKTWTHDACVLTFREKVGGAWEDVGESSFTMKDAQAAKVVRAGGSWDKFPKAMLFARALSQGLRTYCPDVSAAPIYNPEEMGATVNEDGEVTELPASAKIVSGNVKRTTEEIPIEPIAATPIQATEPKPTTPIVEGTPAEAPKAATREPGSDDGEEELIDLPRQRALHRAFKDAVRNLEAKKGAENFLRDWLKHQGYVGPDGQGTTKTIPMALFDEVRTAAVRYAAQMPS